MMEATDGKTELEYSQELLDMLQPGKAIEVFYNEDNICHIRAIVDEEYIVHRVQARKGWDYFIAPIYEWHLRFEKGYLSIVLEG